MSPEEQIREDVKNRVDTHMENDRTRWLIMAWSIIILFVIILVIAIGGAITIQKVENNSAAIRVNSLRYHTADDHISFRICQRDSVNRAFAQSFSLKKPKRLRAIQDRLPILDCTPNIVGKPARELPHKQQTIFVIRFIHGDLTARDQGICRRDVREAVC